MYFMNQKFIYRLLSAVITINLMFLIFYSFDLRPAADDYCFGSIAAEFGFFGGYIHWLKIWSGYFYPMLVQHIVVGLPLAYLSDSFISSIPFLLALFGFGFTTYTLVVARYPMLIKKKFIFVLCISFFWWIFLWIGESFGIYNNMTYLSGRSLTHWQTLNGEFFSIQLFISALILAIAKINTLKKPFMIMAILLLGFTLGTSRTAFALTILVVSVSAIFYFFYIQLKKGVLNHYYLILLFLFSIFLVVGFYVSQNTPGHLNRASIINASVTFNYNRLIEASIYVLRNTFYIFADLNLNLGSVFVFVFSFFLIPYFLSTEKENIDKNFFLKASLFTFLISLLLTAVTVFAQFLTYAGWYHHMVSYFFIFLSMFFIAIYFHLALGFRFVCLKPLALLIFFVVTTYTNIYAIGSIVDRHETWIKGPATIDGISDIADPEGWQRACWNNLDENRKNALDRKIILKNIK